MPPRGGARPGAGRKPKPTGEKQTHTVSVNLTPGEYGELADLARVAGDSLGGYLRTLLLRHLRRGRKR